MLLSCVENRIFDCRACGMARRHAVLYTKNHCAILRCRQCGLGRTQTSNFYPETYYTGEYFNGGRIDGYPDYLGSEHVLRSEFARTIHFIRKFTPRGRLLEIGCAFGFFLNEAQRYYDVAGIEVCQEAAAYARSRDLKVQCEPVTDQSLTHMGRSDVVVMLDVIEHLEDPPAIMAAVGRHLAPGGIIILTTGDFSSLAARLLGRHWRLMTPPQHLWFFTPQSMRALAHSAGLHVASIDRPWKNVPLSLVAFQIGRMLGRPLQIFCNSKYSIPVNFLDAMRVVLRKPLP